MNLVVTCGPAWEPLDGMRRLTNASTGRLGAILGESLTAAGHRVWVFRGDGATAPPPAGVARLSSFGTNDDLARQLQELGRSGERVDAVLHVAALCDFRVAGVRDRNGQVIQASKIPSRTGNVTLELEPAAKLLPRLRTWFPGARVVGWKFELNGGRADALAAAWRQLSEASTDACVLNGAAWGEGFGLCVPVDRVIPCVDAVTLAGMLEGWLQEIAKGRGFGSQSDLRR